MDGLNNAKEFELWATVRKLCKIVGWSSYLFICTSFAVVWAKEAPPTQNSFFDPFVSAQREDAELHSLFPLSPDRIWAVGDRGLILASEDGGIHWRAQESGTTCSLRDIFFVDPLRGWAVGYAVQPFSRRAFGVVLSTIDGGKKWNYTPQPLLPPLHGIRRTANGNLIVWGGWSTQLASSVFESIDGGKTWAPSPNVTAEYTSIFPLMSGWIGTAANGTAFHWELHQTTPVGEGKLWNLFQCDGENVVGIDREKQLCVGPLADVRQWRNAPSPRFLSSIGVLGVSKRAIFAAGSPSTLVARSDDSGKTWHAIESPIQSPLKLFTFLDENRGWAISEMGDIVATRDGGKSWWVQRNGFTQLGMMFIVSDEERIPWTSIAYCTNETQRATGMVVVIKNSENSFEAAQTRRRIQAAAGSIGVTFVKFVHHDQYVPNSTDKAADHTFVANEITECIHGFVPEVIVVGNSSHSSYGELKDHVLRVVLDHAQSLRNQNSNLANRSQQKKVHKVYALSHNRARSLEITGSLVLKRSGKLLGEVTQRATSLIEEQVELDHPESLLLMYSENPGEGAATDIGSGFLSSPDASRRIELGHQGNLQVVLGSTARRKSLQRLVESSRKESRDESWDDYFKQVVDSLTQDELEPSLIWLADRLREQGKWLHWQLVAETLIRRQPNSGSAEVMWRQLLTVAASAELNHWREREVTTLPMMNASSEVVTASASESDTPPTSPFGSPPTTKGSNRLDGDDSTEPIRENSEAQQSTIHLQPKNLALMQWIMEQLPQRHPTMVGEPDIMLQFSSWFHRYALQTPLVADVQNGLKMVGSQTYPNSWREIAETEAVLWNASGLSGSPSNSIPIVEAGKAKIRQPVVTAQQTWQRPLLDGLPDDPCWQNAKTIELSKVQEATTQTEVRIAFDEEWLFVWISCERDPQIKRSEPTVRRGYDSDLSNEDRVRLTLDVDRDRATTFQFEIDQRGLTRDACWALPQWNPRWFVAQQQTETHWLSEFAIPLEELTANTRVIGNHWCLGIERQSGQRTLGKWPTNPRSRNLRPIDLGLLQFTTAPVAQPPVP